MNYLILSIVFIILGAIHYDEIAKKYYQKKGKDMFGLLEFLLVLQFAFELLGFYFLVLHIGW
jgi:hypothetical protein